MPMAEVFPFADIGDPGSFPAWIRGLRRSSGVYIIKDLYENAIGYVGESHSNRLYSTLTRHFQEWTDAHETSGVTYDRHNVEVAVIVVPAGHAMYLQNELICALGPLHNKLVCGDLFEIFEDYDDGALMYIPTRDGPSPPGYEYNVDLLLEGIDYRWSDYDDHSTGDYEDYASDVPF